MYWSCCYNKLCAYPFCFLLHLEGEGEEWIYPTMPAAQPIDFSCIPRIRSQCFVQANFHHAEQNEDTFTYLLEYLQQQLDRPWNEKNTPWRKPSQLICISALSSQVRSPAWHLSSYSIRRGQPMLQANRQLLSSELQLWKSKTPSSTNTLLIRPRKLCPPYSNLMQPH